MSYTATDANCVNIKPIHPAHSTNISQNTTLVPVPTTLCPVPLLGCRIVLVRAARSSNSFLKTPLLLSSPLASFTMPTLHKNEAFDDQDTRLGWLGAGKDNGREKGLYKEAVVDVFRGEQMGKCVC